MVALVPMPLFSSACLRTRDDEEKDSAAVSSLFRDFSSSVVEWACNATNCLKIDILLSDHLSVRPPPTSCLRYCCSSLLVDGFMLHNE